MKTKTQSLRVLITAAALLAPITLFANPDSNHWDFSTAKTATNGTISIIGSGGRIISSEDPAITLVDDKGAPGGKALSFSGAQQKSPSVGAIYDKPGPLLLKCSVKPAPGGGEDQTILVHPGVYEIRYSPSSKNVTIYFPQEGSQKAAFVQAPLPPDKWTTLEVSAKGGEAKLTVGGKTVSMSFSEGTSLQSASSYVRIGMMPKGRPFKGLLADLTISDPAE